MEELVEYAVRFKDIDGYVGLYQVTDDGRVFSNYNEMFLKPSFMSNGYVRVTLCKNGIRKYLTIHKLVASAFLDNPDEKHDVDHINANKTDNNLSNLRYATRSQNNMNKGFQKNNKLKIKGVSEYQKGFLSQIAKDGKQFSKTFKKLDDAIAWRKAKEVELFGEFNFKEQL